MPFLDILRGIAVLWMIETHVVGVCLDPAWKTGFFYNLLYWSNGTVAQAFAFCAGAGLWLSASRNQALFKFASPSFWKHVRRLGLILGIGYWLNMKPFSLGHLLRAQGRALQDIAQCDILHVIVISSLAILILLMITGRVQLTGRILLGSALLIFLVTPLVWAYPPLHQLPIFLAMPLSPIPPSKFPLFPWMGYVFAGFGVTDFLQSSERPKRTAVTLAILSLVTPFIIFWIKQMNFTYPGTSGPYVEWYASPGHSLFRLSNVVLIYCLLFLSDKKWNTDRFPGHFLQLSGQESLQIYMSHVIVVYGTSLSLGLLNLCASRMTSWSTLAIFIFLSASCTVMAAAWHRLKRSSPDRARLLLYSWVVLNLVFFFVLPER